MTKRGKRRLAAILVVILLGTVGMFVVDSVRAAQERKLVAAARTEGLAAFEAGDLEMALTKLSYVFQQEKRDFEVNFAFAEARSRRPIAGGRHLWEAVDLLSNHCLPLVKSDPVRSEPASRELRFAVYRRLLDLHCQIGLTFEVIKTADALLQLDADCIEAMSAKTEALCMERQFEAALPLVERLIALQPEAMPWRRVFLQIQSESGWSPEQRIEQCLQWSQQHDAHGGDGRFHVLTAAMLLDLNRIDEARQSLHAAASRGAGDKDVLARAVELMDLLKNHDQANALLESTVNDFPGEAWPREVAIRRLFHANQLSSALSAIEQAQHDLSTPSAELQQLHVLTLISARQFQKAREVLAALRAEALNSPLNDERRVLADWSAAVDAALDENRPWLDRMHTLQQAIADSPDDAALHSLIGDAWIEVGDFSLALQSYERATTLNPEWLAAGTAYAEALVRSGRLEEAYRAARALISRGSDEQIEPLLLFARAYLSLLQAGRIIDSPAWDADVARDLLSVLRDLYAAELPPAPRRAVAALLAEAIYQVEGEGAIKAFLQDRADNGAGVDAEELLALANVAVQRSLPACESLLDEAQTRNGDRFAIAMLRAQWLAQQGRAPDGLKLIEAAMNAAMPSPHEMIGRGAFMLQHGLAEGVEAIAALVAQYPDSIEVQQLALGEPAIWDQTGRSGRELATRALGNLRIVLGENAPSVRLAEANLLLRKNETASDGDIARAIRLIEETLRQSPDSLAALSLMAEAALRIQPPNPRNLDRAVACLEHAAGLYPSESSIVVRLVSLLQQQGEYAKAGRYLHSLASTAEKNPQLHGIELKLWQHQGDFENALVRAAAIVNEQSSTADQLILAAIHQRAGNEAEARNVYDRLLQAAPDDPMVLSQAAEFFAGTGDFDRGLQLLDQLAQSAHFQNEPGHADVLLGAFHQRHGKFQKAGEHLQRAVAQYPESVEARRELAWHAISQNDRQSAAAHALTGLKNDSKNASLRSALAVACLGLNTAERQQVLAEISKIQQRTTTAGVDSSQTLQPLIATLQLLGQIPMNNGRFSATPSQLAAARRLIQEGMSSPASRFVSAWQAVIQLHVDAGQVNEAIGLARGAVSRFPAEVEPSQWATQLLLAQDELPDSREALAEAHEWRRRALLAGADFMAPDIVIASILLNLDRGDDAAVQIHRHADRLWRERQRRPDQLAVWLQVQAASNAYLTPNSQTRERLLALFNEDARWRQAWLGAVSHLDQRRAISALTLLEETVCEPEEFLAMAAEWTMLGKSGGPPTCFDRARDLALRAATHPPFQAASLIAQGTIAEATKNWPEAEAFYTQALQIDSADAVALNNLAFLLSQHPHRCPEALVLIDRALNIMPDQPDFLDTKARVLVGLDRAAEAHALLQRATQLRPADIGIALTLVEVQLQQHQDDAVARALLDLQQRMRLQRRLDPDLQARFDELWQRFQQSRIGPAL